MRILFFLLFTFCGLTAYSTSYFVGANQFFLTPNALYNANVIQDGDSIFIKGQEYIGNDALAVWDKDNLYIKGIEGRPHLNANGKYIWGKGIWVCSGNNIIVDNVEFSGATVPDKNGAGIRLDGSGITILHCYFHENENGLLTNNTYDGTIRIEFSEFEGGGFGDGYSHNIYIGHNDKLIFRYNYIHHANVGHNLKSRAEENIIEYNRIMDESTGNSSRLIDLPNGGFALIMGNLLMQGPEALNYNLIGYGLEGLVNETPSELYVINNTIVNGRGTNSIFLDIEPGLQNLDVSNNIFTGKGTIINGENANVYEGNVEWEDIEELLFEDGNNYNYRLKELSPAVNVGVLKGEVNGYSLIPDKSYKHAQSFEERILGFAIDAGAYEYNFPTKVEESDIFQWNIFPNPSNLSYQINIDNNLILSMNLYNFNGQFIRSSSTNEMNVSDLNAGFYTVKLTLRNKKIYVKKFIIQ